MNYADLVSAVQNYLENDETTFVALIPTFVRMAEKRIYDETQLLVSRKNVTTTTTNGQAYVQAPSDFLAPFSLAVVATGTHSYLTFVDETLIREAYPVAATTGMPRHYSMFDHNTFLLGPTPNATYTLELHYFNYPTSIVSSSTSWLGDNAENALLYGTILEGYRYMKGDPGLMAEYKKHFDDALGSLKMYSAGRVRGDAYRYGQFKVPVQA